MAFGMAADMLICEVLPSAAGTSGDRDQRTARYADGEARRCDHWCTVCTTCLEHTDAAKLIKLTCETANSRPIQKF